MKRTKLIEEIEAKFDVRIYDTQRIGGGIKVVFAKRIDAHSWYQTYLFVGKYEKYEDAFYDYFGETEAVRQKRIQELA